MSYKTWMSMQSYRCNQVFQDSNIILKPDNANRLSWADTLIEKRLSYCDHLWTVSGERIIKKIEDLWICRVSECLCPDHVHGWIKIHSAPVSDSIVCRRIDHHDVLAIGWIDAVLKQEEHSFDVDVCIPTLSCDYESPPISVEGCDLSNIGQWWWCCSYWSVHVVSDEVPWNWRVRCIVDLSLRNVDRVRYEILRAWVF